MYTIKTLRKTVFRILILSIFFYNSTALFSQVTVASSGKNTHWSSSSSNHIWAISSNKNGIKSYRVKTKNNDFQIEYQGTITISDNDKDIVAISDNGFIEIKKSSFGSRRKIEIHADGKKLIKKYFVGWSEKAYNPSGRKWLAEILPEILRTTTIGAAERVNRFYKKGGTNAVLAEVRKMESDYVQAAYIKLLLKKNLGANDLVAVLQSVGKNISSDYYVSQILKSNQKTFLKNRRTISAYIGTAKRLKSDYYMAEVLKTVISDRHISDDQLGELLDISKNIKSDYYLTVILKEIMDNRTLKSDNVSRVLDLSKEIRSDYYKTEILKKALKTKNLSSQSYSSFLESIKNIKSDYYCSSLVIELMDNQLDNKSLDTVLELVSNRISSDTYATKVFKKLASNNKLTDSQLIKVLQAIGNTINSSYYLSENLVSFSKQVKQSSEKVKEAYRATAKKINSDTYYGRVMKALY